MAYDTDLSDRIREIISLTQKNVVEKEMFGGVCFMVNEKMCVGVIKERLMVRLDPDKYEKVIELDGCEPMNFTGRVMKGYVFVDPFAINTFPKLEYWIKLALDFNSYARKSKKKKP
jgi:TfoX/Sxy family transcriptional regulator of competence genes